MKRNPPGRREFLDILQEEAAEVIQAASKIIRFGVYSSHGKNLTNRDALIQELGDVLQVMEYVKEELSITDEELLIAKDKKKKKMEKYFFVQEEKTVI